jgi:NTE family protein
VPTLLRPHYYEGRTLVDGGVLNPVPITPTLRDLTDLTIAVDVNAPAESLDGFAVADAEAEAPAAQEGGVDVAAEAESVSLPVPAPDAVAPAGSGEPTVDAPPGYRERLVEFVSALVPARGAKRVVSDEMGILELFARSLDAVQETITRFKLAAQPPDVIVRVPRNICAFYDFHRAAEIIEVGRERTREALRQWQAATRRVE